VSIWAHGFLSRYLLHHSLGPLAKRRAQLGEVQVNAHGVYPVNTGQVVQKVGTWLCVQRVLFGLTQAPVDGITS
jgi:hypothetical protein